jgi:hypothetical protein
MPLWYSLPSDDTPNCWHLSAPLQVQESVLDATQAINRLREDVQSLAEWVSSGAVAKGLGVPEKGSHGEKECMLVMMPGHPLQHIWLRIL